MTDDPSRPLWLLAELTYACPLQCPYCSNPIDFARHRRDELSTEEWIRVLTQARAMGSTQLGFSGGEPLVRKDLEILIGEARDLGYYTNLITSTLGMDADRMQAFKDVGLDHIQVSFQASDEELNNFLAGSDSFAHKVRMAKMVKQLGYPMVMNVVLHRHNIDRMAHILDLAIELGADYVELANTQYYGWALQNRTTLMPTREQLLRAEQVAQRYQQAQAETMRILYVVPDYYEDRPKPCMNGWGNIFLTIAPDGTALPCQAARNLPGIEFPNVRDHSVEWIWNESPGFNHFRGFDWMKDPCKTCPERFKDFGGCRCQAYALTGDAAAADPVCSLSPQRHLVDEAIEAAQTNANEAERMASEIPVMMFRNVRNSKTLSV